MKDSDRIRALMGLPPEDSLPLDERKAIDKLRVLLGGKPTIPYRGLPAFPPVVFAERTNIDGFAVPGIADSPEDRLRAMFKLPPKPRQVEIKAEIDGFAVPVDGLPRAAGISHPAPRPAADSSPSSRLRSMFADLSPEARAKLTAQLQGLIKPSKPRHAPTAIHGQAQANPKGGDTYPDVLLADGGGVADKGRPNINGFAVPDN